MGALNVQFSDSTQEIVVAYFAGPQSATTYPNQGIFQSNDARWSTYYDALPVAMQQGLPSPTSV
jgi:hypothetical protein